MDKKDLIQTMDIAVLIPIKSTPDMNTFKHTDLYNFFLKVFSSITTGNIDIQFI